MRKLILTFILILSHSNLYSIEGWTGYQTPLSVRINDVFFINGNTGWAVSDSGKIVKSTDGGLNWNIQSSGVNYALWTVNFLNENTGWCAGGKINPFELNYVIILGTTNGGNSWNILYSSPQHYSYVNELYSLNSSVFVTGIGGTGSGTAGFLWKSTNMGNNWNPLFGAGSNINGIVFKDNQTGWTTSIYADDTGHDTGAVYKTTNSGNTWNKIYWRRNYIPNSIYHFNNDTILIHGTSINSTLILKSNTGGQSWDSIHGASNGNYSKSFFANYNTGWVCGPGGIQKTTNGGANFEQQMNNSARSIQFINSLTGWAAGNNGIVYKTVTGGVTGISSIGNSTPESFNLYQNYPNPFNPSTNIKFDIPKSGSVKINVYDIAGKQIAELLNQNLSPGTYEANWKADNFASGVYFYSLEAEGFKETRKMLLIK